MLYAIAHFLRDKMPWLWDLIDLVNSALFQLRYGGKLEVESLKLKEKVLESKDGETRFKVVEMREVPIEKLVEFFAHQPEEAYTFFKPHGFDAKAIKKLQRNKAFLAYVLIDTKTVNSMKPSETALAMKPSETAEGMIAGYCFNRSFFHGKGFRGRMVDINYRGKGLGTMMNKILNEVGFGIGLRLFETVSKYNVASYRSAISASNFKVVEELPHNELYLEILPE